MKPLGQEPAFPGIAGDEGYGNMTGREGPNGHIWTIINQGINTRDYIAAHAPFTLTDAKEMFGDENASMAHDDARQGVLLMLAMMRYEYADKMLAERASWEERK